MTEVRLVNKAVAIEGRWMAIVNLAVIAVIVTIVGVVAEVRKQKAKGRVPKECTISCTVNSIRPYEMLASFATM